MLDKQPIFEQIDNIKESLKKNTKLILQAPTGSGKSTVVPLSLLNEAYLEDRLIIMLEPRRVAARVLATYMSSLLKEEVGNSVGYQVKMDSCRSSKTKLLIVTEAILIKMLQHNQSLDNVAMIIFDEFHERSIHLDLSLALSLQVQEFLRPDLRLLIMSATMNKKVLLTLIPDAFFIISKGKSYDVQDVYLSDDIDKPDSKSMNNLLFKTILKALKEDEGDILVFLPGVKEIKKLEKTLIENLENSILDLVSINLLYSALEKKLQDKTLIQINKRKIILSTNIAQTSLTIKGIKVVIDSGLEKVSQYNYSKGMDYLSTSFISKDSAIQRAGRAGRLEEGKCYKLWHKNKILQENSQAQILRADLSSLILDLALWGVLDFKELKFIDIPSSNKINESKKLLQKIKMLDEDFLITDFGKDALSLGVHPRFAYMIFKANKLGYVYSATILASLLSSKSIFINQYSSSDIFPAFKIIFENNINSSYINTSLVKEIVFQSKSIYKRFKNLKNEEYYIKKDEKINEEILSVLLLFSFPDRLAKKRDKNSNKYLLSNKKEAVLNIEDSLYKEEFLVVSNLYASEHKSYISSALPISLASLKEYFSSSIKEFDSIDYNKNNEKFEFRKKSYFYSILLSSKTIQEPPSGEYKTLLLSLIKEEGLSFLNFGKKVESLLQRLNFINFYKNKYELNIELSSFEEVDLLENIHLWLAPYLEDIKTIKELRALDMNSILLNTISYENQKRIKELAPISIQVPSGSFVKLDYSNKDTIILPVKIQELFGLEQSPKILNNNFLLQVHLLTPAFRIIQITYDLNSFWNNSYKDVRKELRGKYKKHYWPENPFEAIATSKTKKNMK